MQTLTCVHTHRFPVVRRPCSGISFINLTALLGDLESVSHTKKQLSREDQRLSVFLAMSADQNKPVQTEKVTVIQK